MLFLKQSTFEFITVIAVIYQETILLLHIIVPSDVQVIISKLDNSAMKNKNLEISITGLKIDFDLFLVCLRIDVIMVVVITVIMANIIE